MSVGTPCCVIFDRKSEAYDTDVANAIISSDGQGILGSYFKRQVVYPKHTFGRIFGGGTVHLGVLGDSFT